MAIEYTADQIGNAYPVFITNPGDISGGGGEAADVHVVESVLPEGASTLEEQEAHTTLLTAIESDLDVVNINLTSLDSKATTTNSALSAIDGHIDGLETLVTASNTKLDTVNTALSGLYIVAGNIDSHVDGLEALASTTNSTLSTIDGHVDGIETLITSTNTKLDTVNTNLGTIDGRVDGLEALIGTTNSTLTTIDGRVDGLESQMGATNETAPASDTASSGLNGRLQRIAQNITSLIALLPTSLSNGFFKVSVQEIKVPTTIYNGKKTVTTAGTRVTLASSQALITGVTIKALHANTGTIYVGSSTVDSTNGFVLRADESIFLEVDNLNTVNLDCSVNGEGVTYIAT